MRILVSAASKHGATTEIADAIGVALEEAGFSVTVTAPDEVASFDGYDAAILGSAVYAGHWLEPAKRLVRRREADFATLATWLFSSGPVGEPLKPAGDPPDVADLVAATHAREHRVFGGRIDLSRLGLGERTIVKLVGAAEGDYRPWADIRAWALAIGEELGNTSIVVAEEALPVATT